MSGFDDHIKANPKAQREEAALREAFELLEQLRSAGFEAGEYGLAPTFGGGIPALDGRTPLSCLPNFYRS